MVHGYGSEVTLELVSFDDGRQQEVPRRSKATRQGGRGGESGVGSCLSNRSVLKGLIAKPRIALTQALSKAGTRCVEAFCGGG